MSLSPMNYGNVVWVDRPDRTYESEEFVLGPVGPKLNHRADMVGLIFPTREPF